MGRDFERATIISKSMLEHYDDCALAAGNVKPVCRRIVLVWTAERSRASSLV